MERSYNLGEVISFIKNDVTELLNIKLQLLKLEAVEKGSKGASFLVYGIIVVGLVFFALLFGFLALGFLFSNWLDSFAGGFALVVALYLVLIILLIAFRRSIMDGITNLFIDEMDPDLRKEIEEEERLRKEELYECK